MSSPASRCNSFCDGDGFAHTLFHAHLTTEPLAYIDIGARGGEHAIVEPMARTTRILAFEPDAAECQRLEAELKKTAPWAEIEIVASALAGSITEYISTFVHAVSGRPALDPIDAWT